MIARPSRAKLRTVALSIAVCIGSSMAMGWWSLPLPSSHSSLSSAVRKADGSLSSVTAFVASRSPRGLKARPRVRARPFWRRTGRRRRPAACAIRCAAADPAGSACAAKVWTSGSVSSQSNSASTVRAARSCGPASSGAAKGCSGWRQSVALRGRSHMSPCVALPRCSGSNPTSIRLSPVSSQTAISSGPWSPERCRAAGRRKSGDRKGRSSREAACRMRQSRSIDSKASGPTTAMEILGVASSGVTT